MQKGKFYFKVVISDGTLENRIELKMDEDHFKELHLSLFIDLGLIVLVHKIHEDGEV